MAEKDVTVLYFGQSKLIKWQEKLAPNKNKFEMLKKNSSKIKNFRCFLDDYSTVIAKKNGQCPTLTSNLQNCVILRNKPFWLILITDKNPNIDYLTRYHFFWVNSISC